MTDFAYHTHMQTIVDEDVRFTIEKDTSYGGSWKARGGVGAFMMLARKWDRLEQMCNRHGWDILTLISNEGIGGADGTALAEVRDLRRYLLLVEAEMTEQIGMSTPVPVEDSNRHAERAAPPTESGTPPLPLWGE